MSRTKRLFDEVLSSTGYDIKRDVKIVVCDDEASFLSIQEKMKRKNYRFTHNASALYFPDDRYIVVSPNVRPGTSAFDRVILHELFHHLLAHEMPEDDIKALRRIASIRRWDISMAFSSIGVRMPWNVEERLCDLFSYAVCPHVQRGTSSMRKMSREILESILI